MKYLPILYCCIYLGLVQCIPIPVEVVYTGDGCECPSHMNYEVHFPQPEKKPCAPAQSYGYLVDVPVKPKSRVSYRFDFTVEEPKTPKPQMSTPLNLQAKIDRVAVQKYDCKAHIGGRKSTCACRKCSVLKPYEGYGYVRQTQYAPKSPVALCKCNSNEENSSGSILSSDLRNPKGSYDSNCRRNKRELHKTFLRLRTSPKNMRPGRFVKKYNKHLYEKKQKSLFDIDNSLDAQPKRKPRKLNKFVKRDIKGEYDLLEKANQEMDLTVPEIIQYMPEVLQKDFRRGPCSIGACQANFNQGQQAAGDTTVIESTPKDEQENLHKIESMSANIVNRNMNNPDYTIHKNIMETTYKKRSANDFDYGILSRLRTLVPSAIDQQNAYRAQPYFRTNNPNFAAFAPLKNVYSAVRSDPMQALYCLNENADKLYSPNNEHLLENPPLMDRFVGSMQSPYMSPLPDYMSSRPQKYPVEHISNAQLDQMIQDMIYQHPMFMQSSGGAFIDPEPQQAERTKDFLKKLIEGRLRPSLTEDDDSNSFFNYPTLPGHYFLPTQIPSYMRANY